MNKIELEKFYNGKKIFITGCTGFKGSWLCSILHKFGAKIVGYSLDVEHNSLFYKLHLNKKIRYVEGDIRDLKKMSNVVKECNPDIVFHLAAQPLVIDSYKDPVYTYDVNVMGTVNICESLRQLNKKVSFINVTTDKVYKNIEKDYLYNEDDNLNGYDPYSNSKSCSELVTSSYINSFFYKTDIITSTCRAGNVIGGGDFAANRIVPDTINSIIKNENITLRCPNSIRPYQHVLEPVFAYVDLAMKQYNDKSVASSYNIGPSKQDCIRTIDIATKIIENWDSNISINYTDAIYHEAGLLMLDNSKISRSIEWKQTWSIDEAIKHTTEFYKRTYNGENFEDVINEQINLFLGEK